MISLDLLAIIGVAIWLIPSLAGLWYLAAFKELRDEIKLIRRYLQAIHDQQQKP